MLRRRSIALLVTSSAALAAGIFVACVGDDPVAPPVDAGSDGTTTLPDGGGNTPDGGGGGGDAAVATLSITPARPVVRQGGSTQVQVTLTRNGLLSDVTINVTGLPNGVTVTPTTIASGSTTATFTLAASGSAAVGNATMTVTGTGASDLPASLVVAGAPGALDTSFNSGGLVLDTAVSAGTYYNAAVQADGKILVAGTTSIASGGWLVKRYNTDGSPDTAFNTAAAGVMPAAGSARGIAFDPQNNRIVISGSSGTPTERVTLVRLMSTGAADVAFANAGTMLVSTVEHSQGSRANAVVVLPTSDIVIAGSKGTLAFVDRYLASGLSRDSNFVALQTTDNGVFTALHMLASGAFVATGTDTTVSPPTQIAHRLLANGTPDALFGTGGRRAYASGCRGAGGAANAAGDAFIVGEDVTSPSVCLTRIGAGADGSQVFARNAGMPGGGPNRYTGAVSGPTDTFYAVGYGSGTFDSAGVFDRWGKDGGPDTTFGPDGGNGRVTIEDPQTPDTFKYQPQGATTGDGRLVVVGTRLVASTGPFILRMWE